MWRNHLIIAPRLLVQQRAYAAINIGGLALGLAGCLLILNYIRYERSYDSWLPEHERIHQVQATWHEPAQPVTRSQSSPFPIHDTLAGCFPHIALAGLLALVIALAAVTGHALRVARMNPIHALRYEQEPDPCGAII